MEDIKRKLEEIKRKLAESGVIPFVLDNFNPRVEITVLFGEDKGINIGDEVTLDQLRRQPIYVEHDSDPSDGELQETSTNPCLVASVLTDPDVPGGEYLHLLSVQFLSAGNDIDLQPTVLVAYEPPRSGADMLVFTLFKIDGLESIARPNSRKNFCTKGFARTYALGSPLGASFFNIKYENHEDEKQKDDDTESPTSIAAQTKNLNIAE